MLKFAFFSTKENTESSFHQLFLNNKDIYLNYHDEKVEFEPSILNQCCNFDEVLQLSNQKKINCFITNDNLENYKNFSYDFKIRIGNNNSFLTISDLIKCNNPNHSLEIFEKFFFNNFSTENSIFLSNFSNSNFFKEKTDSLMKIFVDNEFDKINTVKPDNSLGKIVNKTDLIISDESVDFQAAFYILNPKSNFILYIVNGILVIQLEKTDAMSIDDSLENLDFALRYTIDKIFNNGIDKASKRKSYSKFARFYDRYMEHVDYQGWSDFILSIYHKLHQKYPEKLFELACGTGTFLDIFSKAGIKCSGSDNSKDMLKIAIKKTGNSNLYLRDLTDKIPENNNDLIICLFDSVNYLLSKKKIHLLLDQAYIALKNKGLFVFDISTFYNSSEYFKDFINLENYDKNFIIHQADFNQKTLNQSNEIIIFEKNGNLYEKFTETHNQKIFSTLDWLEIIRGSKFELRGIFLPGKKSNLLKELDKSNNQKSVIKKWDKSYPRLFFVLEKND